MVIFVSLMKCYVLFVLSKGEVCKGQWHTASTCRRLDVQMKAHLVIAARENPSSMASSVDG